MFVLKTTIFLKIQALKMNDFLTDNLSDDDVKAYCKDFTHFL